MALFSYVNFFLFSVIFTIFALKISGIFRFEQKFQTFLKTKEKIQFCLIALIQDANNKFFVNFACFNVSSF
jgi:hypothetical protein